MKQSMRDSQCYQTPWAKKAIINAIADQTSEEPLHKRAGKALWEAYETLPEVEKNQFDVLDVTVAHLEMLYEAEDKSSEKSMLTNLFESAQRRDDKQKVVFDNSNNLDLAQETKEFYEYLKHTKEQMPGKKEQFPGLYQNWQKKALTSPSGKVAERRLTTKTLEATMQDFFEKSKDQQMTAEEYKYTLCDHLIRSEKTGVLYAPFRLEDVNFQLHKYNSKIPKNIRNGVLQEFEIASSLCCEHDQNALKDKCYIDTKSKTSFTEEEYSKLSPLEQQSVVARSWEQGGWLVDLRDKHPIQWALEKNDALLRDGRPSLSLDAKDGSVAILDHADKIGIRLQNRRGADVSAVEFCLQENLQITDDQDIIKYISDKPTMAQHSDKVLKSLDTPEKLNAYIDSVVRDPYLSSAHDLALSLVTPGSKVLTGHSELLDGSTVRKLCQSSGIKFGEHEYTLSNLLRKAAQKGVVEYHAVKNSIAEECYKKAAELEVKILAVDNPQKQGFLDRASEAFKGIDHFSSMISPELPTEWQGPGSVKKSEQETKQQDPALKKYSTTKLKKIRSKIAKLRESGSNVKKYKLLEDRIALTLDARKEQQKPLQDLQRKYDQIYDLLTVPEISDQAKKSERARERNCKLLTTENSEFYKLYDSEKIGPKKLAARFHANKSLNKSFLDKVAGKVKLVAGATLAGTAAGIGTRIGSGSKLAGAGVGIATGIAAVGIGSAIQNAGDASEALTEKGQVDFVVADEGKYQSVCSAKVRRAIEDVSAREESLGIQARHNPLVRASRLMQQKAQRAFSSKAQSLDDEIEKSGTQIEKTYVAFDRESNISWLAAIDNAKKKGKVAGEKTYNIVVGGVTTAFEATAGFFKGIGTAHDKSQKSKHATKDAANNKWRRKFASQTEESTRSFSEAVRNEQSAPRPSVWPPRE